MHPVVLFITGMGRSGTTLLGDLLGSFDGALCVGELHNIWRRGWAENWQCADGQLFRAHPVWQSVLGAVEREHPEATHADRLVRADRLRKARHRLIGRVPWRYRADAAAYRAEFETIYRTLAKTTGAHLLVDTGKLPFHAALLGKSHLVDFRVLHLTRSPAAIAFARSAPKPTLGSQGQPAELERIPAATIAFRAVKRGREIRKLATMTPFTRLAYEAFTASPEAEIRRVNEDLDLRLGEAELARLGLRYFNRAPGLSFSGNPNRFGPERVDISPDQRWRTQMPPLERRALDLLGRIGRAA